MFQNITKVINIEQIISVEFWFRNPGLASAAELTIWLALFSLVILLGISILLFNKIKIGHYPPKNKILKPAGIGLILTGPTGVIFSLLRWQGIDFLGVRAILLIIFIVAIGWILTFSYLYCKKIPEASIKYEAKQIKKKYLSDKT